MAGKGWQAHSLLNKALQANTAGGFSVRHRPQTNSQQLAGLAAKTTAADDLAGPLPCRAVQVGGGSAKVLALRKAGADLPNLSLPHLSPLPVTVPTHSLNFEQTQFSPKHYFFFVIFLIFFLYFPLQFVP